MVEWRREGKQRRSSACSYWDLGSSGQKTVNGDLNCGGGSCSGRLPTYLKVVGGFYKGENCPSRDHFAPPIQSGVFFCL